MQNKRAQIVVEYAALFAVVAAAFMAAQHFIGKSFEGKMKQVQDEMSEPVVDEGGNAYVR